MKPTLYSVKKDGPITLITAKLLDTGFGGLATAAGIAQGVFVKKDQNIGTISCLIDEDIISPCHGSIVHMTMNATVHHGEVLFKLLEAVAAPQPAPQQPV